MKKLKKQGKTKNGGVSTWHGYQNLKNQKRKLGKGEGGNGNPYVEGQYADIENHTIFKASRVPYTGIATKPGRKITHHTFLKIHMNAFHT